jgi:hypothetical protein
MMMDQRRTRMRRRPSDQARRAGFGYGCHHRLFTSGKPSGL